MKALAASTVLAISLGLGLVACTREASPPGIAFAPWDKSHASKPDFAQVDYAHPIPAAEMAKITVCQSALQK